MSDQQKATELAEAPRVIEPVSENGGLSGLWRELKRRHVVRVATVYVVVAWLIIQVANSTFAGFGIPPWAFRFVVIILLLGLPVCLIIAWAFELTPQGIKATTKSAPANIQANIPSDNHRKRHWYAIIFAAAVPTFIFASLALVFNLRPVTEDKVLGDSAGSLSPATTLSVAVLPLINMSANPENAFFAGGVHEDILTNLSRINGLKVISRTSAMRYANSKLSLRDIGTALGARYLVEGSVRRINNHVRVTVQLIDAHADTHLWANNYDRELIDVFATQSAVAREISNSLHLAIQPETVGTLQGMPTYSVKAYDLYIKARGINRSEHQSELSLTRQRQLLEAALAEDPDFVEAWAFLNEVLDTSLETHHRLDWFLSEQEEPNTVAYELYAKSEQALKKAMALQPDNLETLIARASGALGEEALIANADPDNRALRKKIMDYTLEKYPDSAIAWYVLGWWQALYGADNTAATKAFKRALELDPFHAHIVEGCLSFFRSAGDQEMVTLLFNRLAQISPEKGKDIRLAQLSKAEILFSLLMQYVRTADEAVLAKYVDEINNDRISFANEIEERYFATTQWELENNIQALLDMRQYSASAASLNDMNLHHYLGTQFIILAGLQIAGQDDDVKRIARRMTIQDKGPNLCVRDGARDIAEALAFAYTALGESDKAQQWTDKLFDERSGCYDSWGGLGLNALALSDRDQAVDMLFTLIASRPVFQYTDWLAALHMRFRPLLLHPDVQAYLVKEDKWIDYLAERVPEYKQFKKKN